MPSLCLNSCGLSWLPGPSSSSSHDTAWYSRQDYFLAFYLCTVNVQDFPVETLGNNLKTYQESSIVKTIIRLPSLVDILRKACALASVVLVMTTSEVDIIDLLLAKARITR